MSCRKTELTMLGKGIATELLKALCNAKENVQ